jgi:hypothetical protein
MVVSGEIFLEPNEGQRGRTVGGWFFLRSCRGLEADRRLHRESEKGGIPLTWSSEAEVSTEHLLDLRIRALSNERSPGFPAYPAVGREEGISPLWLSTWIAEVEVRSSATVGEISGSLPSSACWWVKNHGGNHRDRHGC